MSDRLKELERQRALAQEQLARLEREITQANPVGQPPAPSPPAPVVGRVPSPGNSLPAPPATPSADDLIAQYQGDVRPVRSEVKRGCFLYFFAALGLLILGLTAFWFLRRG